MLDDYDLARLNGFKGSADDYRKAVYLVNGFEALKKTGFGGNESDARRMFADGGASLSAYDVAVRHGYTGSPLDWLKTLRGSNGMDAYELAVSKGFGGTQDEWLKALVGATGQSAYELAVSLGFSGGLAEWIDSLKGERGDRGERGPRGDTGPMPAHEWDGSAIRFELTPGRWGEWVNVAEFVEPGRVPKHEVDGQRIRFEQPDGEWGQWVTLGGPVASGAGAGTLRLHKFYANDAAFPAVGQSNLLYVTTDSNPYGVWVWHEGAYHQMSGGASSNPGSIISTDANNAARAGTDGGIYVDPPKAMIDDDQVFTGDPAGTVSITLTPTTVPDPENPDQTQVNYSIRGDVNVSQIMSADAGNRATVGTDGKIFSPPAAAPVHAHAISDVTGLQTALDGKSATGHGHVIGDVTGLQTALDGKAATSHTHAIADVTGLQTELDAKATTTALTSGLATKADTVHAHAISDVTGLQTALDSKASSTDLSSGLATKADTVHAHAIADVTGLQTALDGKAASVHAHAIADVTGLQTALDGKADVAHTHAASLYLSSDADNVAVLGTDSKIYVPAPGNPVPPLGIIDNTIADPSLITTPGTYIVPATGTTGVFVGQENKYAVFDGTSFTFSTPTTGDKRAIQTGPSAGEVLIWNGIVWGAAPSSANSVYGSWQGNTPITIGAITTAPTKPTTRQIDRARYRELAAAADGAKVLELDYLYQANVLTGAGVGSGQYLYSLPTGLTFDPVKYPPYTGAGIVYNSEVVAYSIIANGTITNGGNYSAAPLYIVPYDATRFRLLTGQGANINSMYTSSGNFQLNWGGPYVLKMGFQIESKAFSPIELFYAGEKGVWYDPSDLSTLFQDSAGTVPVTAAGQPVGKMVDKSGNGNHAIQATSADRPILNQDAGGRYYLACNGTNTWMQASGIGLTATDKVTVVAGLRKLSDAATGVLAELGTDSLTVNGSFGLFAPALSGAYSYRMQVRGTTAQAAGNSVFAASPDSAVITGYASIGSDSVTLRRNVVSVGSSAADLGSGNFSNLPLYLFRRAGTSIPLNANFYGLLIRGGVTTAAETSAVESWMALKTGVTL